MTAAHRLPVTVVAGWHGVDRTEPVTHLLAALEATTPTRDPQRRSTTERRCHGEVVVVENGFGVTDFGDTTHLLVEEEVVHLRDDCDCCAVRTDLIRVLELLGRRRRPPRRVVLLTGDGADVSVICQTMLGDPVLRELAVLDAVVVAVDALAVATRASEQAAALPDRRAFEQVAHADLIWLSGSHLLSERGIDVAAWTMRGLNPLATIAWQQATGPLASTVQLGAYNLDRVPDRLGRARRTARVACGSPYLPVLVSCDGWLDPDGLDRWVEDLHHTLGADLVRLQGILAVRGQANRWLVQGVRTTLELADGAPWDDESPSSQLLVIGRNVDQRHLRDALAACCS
ncbi:MAG: GTP-binding protein [Acidimicrobiia bacterium]|nr:GTP-binding protein [Acidimicrobiia bacterium]